MTPKRRAVSQQRGFPSWGAWEAGPALVLQEAGLLIFSWKRGIGQETH